MNLFILIASSITGDSEKGDDLTIDRERRISKKQKNKASPDVARLPKEAMLLRDIFKFTKPSLDPFRPFGPPRGTPANRPRHAVWETLG